MLYVFFNMIIHCFKIVMVDTPPKMGLLLITPVVLWLFQLIRKIFHIPRQ